MRVNSVKRKEPLQNSRAGRAVLGGSSCRSQKLGHDVTAFDMNPQMVKYAQAQLRCVKGKANVFAANMTDFHLPQPVDVGACLLDSFRHLTTEESAIAHLRCMARAVRRDGIYLLGFAPSAAGCKPRMH